MYYRRLIALLMVCAYLILPLDSFANLDSPRANARQSAGALLELASPGEADSHCPCSQHHGTDGCNPGCSCCSCCSFCAPLPARFAQLAVPPSTTSFSMREPLSHFPEVYLPIFVPPQNRS